MGVDPRDVFCSTEEGVVPMEITYMDTEDECKKYGTLSSLRYLYSNQLRFPISSLGLPNFPSEKSLDGALAKYTANDQTLTRQNCNITLIPRFQSNTSFLPLAF
jgi:hypothetical protein